MTTTAAQLRANITQINDIIDSISNEIEYAQDVRDRRRLHAARDRMRHAKDIRWTYTSELKRLKRK